MKTAILASQNKNKIREIQAILEKYDFSVISRDEAGIPTDDIEETGTTFEDNSYLKARTIFDVIRQQPELSRYLDSPVIADDSGLMVDALNGAPGVYSARYAGEGCTYDDNNVKLLSELKDIPQEGRGAQFVTVITLIYPDSDGVPQTAEKNGDVYVLAAKGVLKGHIASEKRGTEGFGYDPVFIPEGFDKTFAELGTDFKNTISHRAKALEELERLLEG